MTHPTTIPVQEAAEGALQPCPFCGSAKVGMSSDSCPDGGGAYRFAQCRKCGAQSRPAYAAYGNDCPIFYAGIREEWNRRAALSAAPYGARRSRD